MQKRRKSGKKRKKRYPHRKKNPWRQLLTAMVLVLVVAVWWVDEQRTGSLGLEDGEVRCTQVIDGDTFEASFSDGRRERIRVLGIDTMETHNEEKRMKQASRFRTTSGWVLRMGKEAEKRARSMLFGRTIKLYSPYEQFERDPYSRLLCYVEVDGEDFGALLLRDGLAEARREPHARSRVYKDLENQARRERIGIFGMK